MIRYLLILSFLLFNDRSLAEDHDVLVHNKELISPVCIQSRDERNILLSKFHGETTCNLNEYNAYKAKLTRQAWYKGFMERGTYNLVPDQRTIICPAVVQDLYQPNQETGYDSDWIVENKAMTPVVLVWIDPDTRIEYSAVSRIQPPQADPEAILQPGQWRHINTFQGHVFYALELLPDGTTGRVLLQYRAGLIPIGEKHTRSAPLNTPRSVNIVQDGKQVFYVMNDENSRVQQQIVVANSDSLRTHTNFTTKDHLEKCSLHDPEPTIKHVVKKEVKTLVAPKFQRTPARELIDCHQLFLGFRNRAGCPLHGYFVDTHTCHEKFRIHLGTLPPQKSLDFHHDWSSETAFETSYIGHSFVFRSSSDPSILVDEYDVRATQIVDCPSLQQQQFAVSFQREIPLPVLRLDATPTNSTLSSFTNESFTLSGENFWKYAAAEKIIF